MRFLDIPYREIEDEFGPKFLFASYLRYLKTLPKPQNLIFLTKVDFEKLVKAQKDLNSILDDLKSGKRTLSVRPVELKPNQTTSNQPPKITKPQ